jgi:phosphatidate cytidylyltransferase
VTEKNRNLLLRIASAAVAIPILLYVLWRGGLPMACVVAFAAGVNVFEFYRMALGRLDPPQALGIAVGSFLPLALNQWPQHFPTIVVAAAMCMVVVFLSYYLLRGERDRAPERASLLVFGVFYGALLLSTLCGIRQFRDGAWWLLLTLVATWLNDTGAYTFGRLLGRHPLAPSVSPSKTWEGFFGGMATSMAGAFAVRALYFPDLRASECVFLPVVVGVLGPLGDLCESMMKRAYGAKDSGGILPGHGGFLDRVDALLFTAPAIYLYVLMVR